MLNELRGYNMNIPIKAKLKKGEVVYGAMVCEIRNPNIVRIYQSAGLDFAVVDMEHGPFGFETVEDMASLAKNTGFSILTRIPEIKRDAIMKPLDCGAAGVIVPQVEDASDMKKVIEYAKYAPLGNRGRAFLRSHTDFGPVDEGKYCLKANEDTLVIAMIETQAAVDNLEEIMSLEGVDGAFLGPADLSSSMCLESGGPRHPRIIAAIEKEIEVCKKFGKAAGIHLFDIDLLTEWVKKGITLAVFHTDVSFLRNSITGMLSKLKA
jgi:2-keto-3-deoxy-L-rhamnonate aldolase RhmA